MCERVGLGVLSHGLIQKETTHTYGRGNISFGEIFQLRERLLGLITCRSHNIDMRIRDQQGPSHHQGC